MSTARRSYEMMLPTSSSSSVPAPTPEPKNSETKSKLSQYLSQYPLWFMLGAIPGLILSTCTSILLLYTTIWKQKFPGPFYNFVSMNRANVQVLVQIISRLLGIIHIFVGTAIYNAHTRNLLRKGPISLDRLKYWNSVCNMKSDLSLPPKLLAQLLFYVASSSVPAILWTGAITPIISSTTEVLEFDIPHYGPDPQNLYWNHTVQFSESTINRTELGAFSFSPVRNILGSILDGAALATAPNATLQTHRKLDSTGHIFSGRSYGVGGSVGLAALPSQSGLQQYSFFEDGYMSLVTCQYNETMDFNISLAVQSGRPGYPNTYRACGDISGSHECITIPAFHDDAEVVTLLGHPRLGRNIWGIATGIAATKYTNLNRTSCEVVFHPRRFLVSVNADQKVINVTSTDDEPNNIDPTSPGRIPGQGQIAESVVTQIGLIVQTSSSAAFSTLGNAFVSNIANTNVSRTNGFSPQALDDASTSLLGIASSLEAMVDDILLAIASAQFVIAGPERGGIQKTKLDVVLSAVKIGEPIYIYPIFGVNAILLIFVIAGVYKKTWKGKSVFDYADLKSVVIGSSLGGGEVARKVFDQKLAKREEAWTGEPGDKTAGKVLVTLDEQHRIVLK